MSRAIEIKQHLKISDFVDVIKERLLKIYVQKYRKKIHFSSSLYTSNFNPLNQYLRNLFNFSFVPPNVPLVDFNNFYDTKM